MATLALATSHQGLNKSRALYPCICCRTHERRSTAAYAEMRHANESRRSDRQPPVCPSPPAAAAESYKHCSADLPPHWECSRMRGQQAGNAFVSIARKIVETPAHPDVPHTPQCTLAQQRCALPRASRIGHAPLSLLRANNFRARCARSAARPAGAAPRFQTNIN